MPLIALSGIRKRYGGQDGAPAVEVLHGIDLSIGAGEFIAIVGASGSGNTIGFAEAFDCIAALHDQGIHAGFGEADGVVPAHAYAYPFACARPWQLAGAVAVFRALRRRQCGGRFGAGDFFAAQAPRSVTCARTA